MDRLIEPERRDELVAEVRAAAVSCARRARTRRCWTPPTTPCAPPRAPTSRSRAAVLGRARDRGRPRRALRAPRHARAVQAPLGGRGVKGEEWRKLLAEDFRPRLERMWAEADYLHPRALLGYFPCYSEGNDIVVLDPEDRETVLPASRARASPRATASASPTSTGRRSAASWTSSRCRA